MSVLEVENLTVAFRTPGGKVHALTEASFQLDRGDLLVVIGESGSGKTVLAHAILRLLPLNVEVTGAVRLRGTDLLKLSETAMQGVRGRRIALSPQSAGSALNPVRRIGSLMLEVAQARGLARSEARKRLAGLLAQLGLSFDEIKDLYPHQLSGGMQQRVVNALAMVREPEVVIADEPTFGLDQDLVDTTAEQLQQIRALGSALLVITHDLRLAERLGGRVAVVYASYLVELRTTSDFFIAPAHPYSRALLNALPERGGIPIPGLSPELTALPPGCPFSPRCGERFDRCDTGVPGLLPQPDASGFTRCYLYAKG